MVKTTKLHVDAMKSPQRIILVFQKAHSRYPSAPSLCTWCVFLMVRVLSSKNTDAKKSIVL